MRNNGWESVDTDMDRLTVEKTLSGVITPWRLWMIFQWVCRKNVGRIHVASPYDCTGQKCGQYCHMEVSEYTIKIVLTEVYDY
jgi:hypothetical protein